MYRLQKLQQFNFKRATKVFIRTAIFVITLIFSLSLDAQTKNPFSKLKFDKVMFYDFQAIRKDGLLIVDSNCRFLQRISKEVRLDSVTINKLNVRLGQKNSYGNVTASCFDPHCGFVYYLKNKPVVQISICIACNRLYSTIDIPAQQQGKQGEGDDVYYIADGLSKSLRQFINGLLKKYSFTHQLEPGSYFDR